MRRSVKHIDRNKASLQIEKMIQLLLVIEFAKRMVEGARLLDKDGNVLSIPQGALASTIPVETKLIPASTITGIVGSDFTLLRAVDVNFTGRTLSTSAELSIPAPTGTSASLPIVVARAIEIKGVKKLKLVALARLSGSLITSSLSGLNGLNGISTTGQYFFLQAKAALGFANGIVKDGSSKAYPSAQVTTNTCSLVDLTDADGKYLVASTVANFTLTASDIYKNDKGQRVGTITAGNQSVSLDVTINVTPPSVASVAPADGELGVDPKAQIVITMSEAVKPESVTSINVYLEDSTGTKVSGVFALSPDGMVITFYPSQNLTSETVYSLTVTHSIQDLQGYFMGQDFVSHFTIKDTTPPPMPAAGSIVSSFPDADGYVTITATQGSAEGTGAVLIINDTSGEIVTVAPKTNGSFTGRIMAQLGDEIKILSMDSSGNQTLITYVTFKSDDGQYLVTKKGGPITDDSSGAKLDIPEDTLIGPTILKITPIAQNQLPQDNPIPSGMKFIAGVNVNAGNMSFGKEVQISVPLPANMQANSFAFVAQPQTLLNADGTSEKVYVIVDSAKVVNGRLTSACLPFPGILDPGPYVFLMSDTYNYLHNTSEDKGPVTISGFTYRDMDNLPGYQPGLGDNNDKPISNAIVRAPGAANFISYSDKNGHYATYGFTAPDVCRNFPITAIHPQTMNRVTVNITTCDAPYIVDNFNFKLADKNTQLPDKGLPSIDLNMKVVPGQTDDPKFVAGTVPVGTDIAVPITVIDENMGSVTLSVSYKTPDMISSNIYQVPAVQSAFVLYTAMTSTQPARYKYSYNLGFSSPIGSASGNFKPNQVGSYIFTVEAKDSEGNKSSKTLTVRAIQPGTQPDGIDGPPTVDELVPADGAEEIMVTMPVMATFNEPISMDTVNSSTFKLIDLGPVDAQTGGTSATYSAIQVNAAITTSLEGGRVRATLQPMNNLMFGHKYKVVLTQGITDANGNSYSVCAAQTPPQPDKCLLPLDKEYVATFTTKQPQIYDLTTGQFTSGRGIDLYTDQTDGKTYAYVTADSEGWYVIDVTDPTSPKVVKPHKMTNAGVTWIDRGVAVDADTNTLGMTDDIRYIDGNQYGYVRFYDLTDNPQAVPPMTPADPKLIGREKLAEAYSGVPMRLSLMNNYAYVATVNIGLQVVDINAAKKAMQAGQGADGSTIVGVFDTWAGGFKNPTDIVAYKGNKAVLTTTSGHLITLDLTYPNLPQQMLAYKPALGPNNIYNFDSAWRVVVAPDYAYTDGSQGQGAGGIGNTTKVIDLAVTTSMKGRIHTVDITDPYNLSVMGVTKDSQGNEVIVSASDITISKTSGLVYITSGMSVYIIDVKNPNNPVLLNIVTQTLTEPGSTTMIALGV